VLPIVLHLKSENGSATAYAAGVLSFPHEWMRFNKPDMQSPHCIGYLAAACTLHHADVFLQAMLEIFSDLRAAG
jgi:hypothetical protein